MRKYILAASLALCGCTAFKPVPPGEGYTPDQQKIFAVAVNIGAGACEDIKDEIKPDEAKQVAAGLAIASGTLSGVTTANQLEINLRNLLADQAKGVRTVARVLYAVNAFIPPEVQSTVAVAATKIVLADCAEIFGS